MSAFSLPQNGRGPRGMDRLRLAVPRRPVHPGRFLETRFLLPLGLTQQALARALGISRRRVNELVRGHRAISADTALHLGAYFGTDPRLWMELQAAWDVYQARRRRSQPRDPPAP